MQRFFVLSIVVVLGGISALVASTARGQIGPPKAYVALQPTTPGTSQSGNINVSGTLLGTRLGIGTGAPGRALHAFDSNFAPVLFESPHASGVATELRSAASGTTWEYGVTGTSGIFGLPNGSAFLRRQFNSEPAIALSPANNIFMNGALGIGTYSPIRRLHVVDPGLYSARFETTTTGAAVVEFVNSASGAVWEYGVTGTTGVFGLPAGSAYLHRQGNGEPAISMTSGNLVGMGTFNPAGRLDVRAGGGGIAINAISSGAGNTTIWADSSSGTAIRGRTFSFGYTAIVADGGATAYGLHATGITGVTGVQTGGGAAAGVHASGNMTASGSKSFKIDHPHDPENKFLMHYCAEGPEPQNIYNGSVVTDGRGYAEVVLPAYYEDINKDARIQLTVVNTENPEQFVQAMVVKKVRGGRFTVRTSAPRVEVFWEVKARRNDLWVRRNGAPVEVEKIGREVGRYEHPELYGESKERGIHFEANIPKNRR